MDDWTVEDVLLGAVIVVIGVVGLVTIILLLEAIPSIEGTTYGQRLDRNFKSLVDDAIPRISGWLPMALGLAILGGVIYGGMSLWSERNAVWTCELDDGSIVVTQREPRREWVEGVDGTLYPRDRVETCVKNEE